jgi:hypothetical protein
MPGAGAVVVVLVVWAAFAFDAAQMVGRTSGESDCYAPRPAWAIAQALVALVGMGAGLLATLRLVRSGGATSRLSRPFGVAGIALLVWVLVVILPGGPDVVLCPGQPPESL